MSREEKSREDLLREATALVVRAEFKTAGADESIVAGFRRDGAASFFFGQQIVYQFNIDGELRRGFLEGRLYKAERGRLVELTRNRTADSVDLLRHELTASEVIQFLCDARTRLEQLDDALSAPGLHIVGQVPPGEDVVGRIRMWLDKLPAAILLANSPRVI
jgi:hypothetical protein